MGNWEVWIRDRKTGGIFKAYVQAQGPGEANMMFRGQYGEKNMIGLAARASGQEMAMKWWEVWIRDRKTGGMFKAYVQAETAGEANMMFRGQYGESNMLGMAANSNGPG